MISKHYAITLACAFCVGAWLARTEMGAHVRTAPPHETLHTVFSSLATFAEGRMPKPTLRTDLVEPIAEFRADEPLRRLASAVGMLVIESHDATHTWLSDCTAVVIAPDTIITNFHCVPGSRAGEVIDRITLWLDYVDVRNVTKINVVLQPLEQDQALDYAILKLEKPVNSATHVLAAVRLREALPGERLALIHHARGAPQQVSRMKCRIAIDRELTSERVAHTCWTAPGSSGALIFAERDQAILGLHRSAAKGGDAPVGYATPAMMLLARSPTLKRLSQQSPR
jgi:hypothetical protein